MNDNTIKQDFRAVLDFVERHVQPEIVDRILASVTAVMAADLSHDEDELVRRLADLSTILSAGAHRRFRAHPPVTHASVM